MDEKQIVLITGVSREMGLGFETAKQIAAKGFKVIITARNVNEVSALAEKLQSEKLDVLPLQLDILSDDSVNKAVDYVSSNYGKLDVLINNAGAFYDAGMNPLETDFEFALTAFETNLYGAWRMVKHFVPLLQKTGRGKIVNVSSGAGSFSDPDFGLIAKANDIPVYGITKLALNGLTVKLAAVLKEKNIKINAVCPGFTATYPGTSDWGARPVSEGARGIVWAATLPDDGPTGGFFRDGKPLGW